MNTTGRKALTWAGLVLATAAMAGFLCSQAESHEIATTKAVLLCGKSCPHWHFTNSRVEKTRRIGLRECFLVDRKFDEGRTEYFLICDGE